MSTQLFTNRDGNTLIKKFEGVFTYMPGIACFDVLVGYFRASGYFRVRPLLDRISKVRILVGIDVDRLTKDFHDRGQTFLKDGNLTRAEFLAQIAQNIHDADYDKQTENGIIQFIDDLIDQKIQLRAHPEKTIHAKVYIFKGDPFNEHTPCEFITGSSNLTAAGLGINDKSNYEFNISVRDYPLVKAAADEFELLWNESVPILKAEAEKLRQRTYLRDNFTPFELYIKMLIEYFGKRVDYDPYNIEMLLPLTYYKLKYQTDAANQGYAIMMKHNGFILADVVGLGKTIVACMVIKKFIYENGTHTKLLVVCPPPLINNWKRTARDFQVENHLQFITMGSLAKVLDEENFDYHNADQYDLIVVDESHKFRNDYTGMYLQLQEICKRPRVRRAENGDDRKKVMLISATPLNNSPADIENQLYLFQDRRNSTLERVRNLQDYFKPVKDKYKKLASEPKLNIQKLKTLFAQLRNDIVEPLVIRRTRRDIESNTDYLADLKGQNIKFPKVSDPIELYYRLDDDLADLFFDTVELITGLDADGQTVDGLKYYRYRAIEHLTRDEDRKQYGNVESISERLAGIMRILLVKRLESSFHAFRGSLTRLNKAIDNMLTMFVNDRVFVAPDLDVNKLLEDGYSYDEIEERITLSNLNPSKGSNNREFKAADFDAAFLDLLKTEKEKVANLLNRWKQVHQDPKLEEFIDQLKNNFLSKKTNPSGQLVIFTESTETAADVQRCMEEKGYGKILSVSSANRKESEMAIRMNFDANVPEEKWQHDYDIVITTEVLAEGVNLHRANVIINYDVPWNSTRLMQRIGRVNRIGTRADAVYVYNFYPSAHGDDEIKLVDTALRKLQAFHTAFGEDNKVFSRLEEVGEGALYGVKIQQEESETEKYLTFLRQYRQKHPKRFRDIAQIPNKARCGRNEANVPASNRPAFDEDALNPGSRATYPMAQTSLTYLKSDNHPGTFCLVPLQGQPIELSFLQAAKLFEASDIEKAIALHKEHHQQTLAGLEYFKTDKVQQDIQSQIVNRQQLSPVENKAITNLIFMAKHAPTEQKRNALNRFVKSIKDGKFASKGMPKEVVDFYEANKKMAANPPVYLDALFAQVLDRYAISADEQPDEGGIVRHQRAIINPKIVLTVSFT
ncbi:helicase-related protein [Spirosoma gilvum]